MSKSVNKVRQTANEIYEMILNRTITSELGYSDLQELRDSLKNKIANTMIEDTMVLRKRKEQEKFMETHLNYITKDDISKENIESM